MEQAEIGAWQMQFDFDLSLVPPPERFAFWHDVGSRVQRPIRSRYRAPASRLSVHARIRGSGELIIARMASSEQYFERTQALIRKDQVDTFLLVLLGHGSVQGTAQDHHFQARAGDLLLLDHQDIGESEWSAHQQLYVVLPRDLLVGQGWTGPATRVLRSQTSCALILSQYLATLWERLPSEAAENRDKLSRGLAGLIRIYFGGLEVLPDLELERQPESLIDSIKRWIGSQLHDPVLGPEQICRAFHLSRSSLYALFKAEGGIRTYLQACRLERARLLLERSDPPLSISTVARQLGFRSLSSFSRAFRDHWGVTARDVRQQACRGGESLQVFASSDSRLASDQHLREHTERYYNVIERLSAQAMADRQ